MFRTIADTFSLPSPHGAGHGYNLEVTSDEPITITLESTLSSSATPNRVPLPSSAVKKHPNERLGRFGRLLDKPDLD